jgi:hypothetical protein
MKTKLNWKKKWLDDKSGYWYSAKVPVVDWEYVVEDARGWDKEPKFFAGLFVSNSDEVTSIRKKYFDTERQAMEACDEHLLQSSEKFNKWLKKLK